MRGRTILMRLLSPSPPLPPSLSSLLIFLPLSPFLSFFPFLPACVFSPSSLSSPAVFLFPTPVPLSLTAGSVGPGTSVCWLFMAKAKHRTSLIDCHSLCCLPTQGSALVWLLFIFGSQTPTLPVFLLPAAPRGAFLSHLCPCSYLPICPKSFSYQSVFSGPLVS